MTPRRLDPAVISERLKEIQLLLADLAAVGPVDAELLRRERATRHVVERVVSQIVELAGSINTHIATSLLKRAPDSYAGSLAIRRSPVVGLLRRVRPVSRLHRLPAIPL